jgi:hypothetical protein
VALVRTEVSEELSASFIRVTRIGELGTTLALTLMKEAPSSSKTSVLTRATWRNIPEDAILLISRLLAPLKFLYSSIQVSEYLVLTVSCSLINFSFRYFLILFLKYLLASHLSIV